jgi:hypothetical protein
LPAESRGNVAALSALQQNDYDDEKTDQNVDRGNQVDHKLRIFLTTL